jgi:hydroxymethylglutaryl-CoA synthase
MTEERSLLLTTDRPVGVVGYGVYIPRYRLPGSEIARLWQGEEGGSPVKEKAVAGLDEDTVTMSIEAARNALKRAGINPGELRAVWVGSESHPYAVKPSSTIVAEAIGATPHIQAADMEFACKAGSEAMVMAMGLVGSGMGKYALAIGADTAQGRPGDALEYTAASGGAAYIIGPAEESLAVIEGAYSFVTDTPDFWRRAGQKYPSHGQRFTGEPAYFKHIRCAATTIMQELGAQAGDFKYVTFHQPNPKFPQRIGKELGFTNEQLAPGLLAPRIGNTYAGASLVGNTAVFDIAEPGDRVLMVSYGSGAGSDAFAFRMTDTILERRGLALSTEAYIARRKEIDYATYVRYRRKLAQ